MCVGWALGRKKHKEPGILYVYSKFIFNIIRGAHLGGAGGAYAPQLFLPRPPGSQDQGWGIYPEIPCILVPIGALVRM